MKKLSLGVEDVTQILQEGYTYVDKTGFALHMIEEGRSCIIIRPKGFGKTLFLSTLEQILKGNKELFQGTEIYKSSYDWPEYLIFRVDFSQIDASSSIAFENGLKAELTQFAVSNGVPANESWVVAQLISVMSNVSEKTGKEIVVLVDEFDAPIINNIQNPHNLQAVNIAEDHRQLIAFFLKCVTRSVDNPRVKFAFAFGLNKFAWIGGDVVHMKNIEMDPEYATLMGFTEAEVKTCFGDHIRSIAQERSLQHKRNVSEEAILGEIRQWYFGYRFTVKEVTVYNPESTLRYLRTKKATNYWYSSRNRSALIDAAARDNMPLGLQDSTVGLRLQPSDFNITRLRYVDVRSLMYYNGYLTIRKYHPERQWYDLDFPNKEAREAYKNTYLLRNRVKAHHYENNNKN